MELDLTRLRFSEKSTIGELDINGTNFCYTLELPKKDGLPGSCIPVGRYQVTTYASPHFGRLMPLIEGVPGRSEIEIHWGNYPDNTRGCILVGHTTAPDFIGESQRAFEDFWAKAQASMESGECWITITEAPQQPAVLDASDN